ncbi:MAG: hypothetical protein BAA02_10705 [Paenibacillaceae bacterium ZCTH02-B3]|nr:MAG: hypothetical protein BAA02_10705 [Paenibacillaceae bacterium ZCTH02-B3]
MGGSFAGATIGFIVLLVLTPTLIYLVNFFGSGERALFAVWALVLVAGGAVTREDTLKSFLSVGLGLALGLIGMQPNVGTFRYTLNLHELWGGLKIIWIVLAVFAIPQLFLMATMRSGFRELAGTKREPIPFVSIYTGAAKVIVKKWQLLLRSSLAGVFVGIMPGIGSTTASWVGYSAARSASREKEKFGKGTPDGVMGAESASNACEVGAIIPLLSLGIPGSAAAAIMLGAFILAGLAPGPGLYVTHGPQMWTIMFGIGLSAVVFTMLAYPFIKGAQWLSHLPIPALIGAIGALCMLGAYVDGGSTFGNMTVLAIGVATVLAGLLGIRPAPLLIGFILGPVIETELIRAYQIGGFARFTKPTSLLILAIILVTLFFSIRSYLRGRKGGREPLPGEPAEEKPEVRKLAAGFVKDMLLVLLVVVLSLLLLAGTANYPALASIWVYFVTGVFILLPALLLLIRNLRIAPAAVAWIKSRNREKLFAINRQKFLDQLVVFLFFVIFIATMTTLGYVVSTFLFVLLVMLYFKLKPIRSLIMAFGVAGGMYVVKTVFQLYVPTGIWNI